MITGPTPSAWDSLLHYRQYCQDMGRKPAKTWGLYDPSGLLKAWSTKRRDIWGLFNRQTGTGWEMKVVP